MLVTIRLLDGVSKGSYSAIGLRNIPRLTGWSGGGSVRLGYSWCDELGSSILPGEFVRSGGRIESEECP
jgi:hypothetical protein